MTLFKIQWELVWQRGSAMCHHQSPKSRCSPFSSSFLIDGAAQQCRTAVNVCMRAAERWLRTPRWPKATTP